MQEYLPFDKLFDDQGTENYGSFFGPALGGMKYKKVAQQSDISLVVECELFELLQGAMKQLTFDRHILTPDQKAIVRETVRKTIEVKPGFEHGHVLTFEN